MAILGIGVDIVSLQRIHGLLKRRPVNRLAQRILSLNEYSLWKSKTASFDNGRFLAVR